ncbi:pentapeptide repeat-containing protein [Nocardia sp. NPDC059240]|uniref:pentapeptide repeat-containing protein n=1 Tax=Nocardia sp. NPDC059240 TaxID=3346786 RepID=UPI00369FCF68
MRPAGTQAKRSIVRAGHRVGRVRLFTAVTLALAAGTGIAVAAQLVLARIITTNHNQLAPPIDVTKLALTVVGGVGGAVALVVAYRRQRDLEQNRFVERFGAAAAQLGSGDVAVRIAGVYAMAGVADESNGTNQQQCIDVLCGYLRLPYDAAHGGSGRTKLVTKTKQNEKVDLEETTEYRQNDREVRKTIVRVIAEHLRDGSTPDWRTNAFDFRAAHLEDADFSRVRFDSIAHFEASAFAGHTSFAGATFSRDTNFGQATFSSYTSFKEATFSLGANFRQAIFSDDTNFEKATFSDSTDFTGATFSGHVGFEQATFSVDAYFAGATFSGDADFRKATFSVYAGFEQATFSDITYFEQATFSLGAYFTGTTFSSYTSFTGAAFSSYADFDTRFDQVAFLSVVEFQRVDFGKSTVSFRSPRTWDPAPRFDWDQDASLKPRNILPQDWPPTVE